MSHDDTDGERVLRRQFLKTAGAATGAALGSVALRPGAAHAVPCAMPDKWDETLDVVVVGTGFAGLTASIEARNAGADVLVIEKMPVYGGNSIVNGGDFAAAGNTFQKAAGIQDSPELMLKDMLRAAPI